MLCGSWAGFTLERYFAVAPSGGLEIRGRLQSLAPRATRLRPLRGRSECVIVITMGSTKGSSQDNCPSSGTRAEHRPPGSAGVSPAFKKMGRRPDLIWVPKPALFPVVSSQKGRAFGPIDLKAGETPALPGGARRHLGAVGVADDFPDRR